MLKKSAAPSIVFQTWAAGRQAKAYWTANGSACAARENFAGTLAAEDDDLCVSTIDFGKVSSALRHRAYPAEARSTLRECDDRVLLDSIRFLLASDESQQLAVPDL